MPTDDQISELTQKNQLIEFCQGKLWIKRSPFRFLGVEIGTRMTIVKLSDGSLFLHSPVRLTSETKAEIDNLGTVRYVVSPNSMHHLFLGDYFDCYRNARFFAPPGLTEKRKDINFYGVLTDVQNEGWFDDLDQVVFLGHSDIIEVAFFHRASKTLIFGDMIFYFDKHSSFSAQIAARLLGIYNQAVPPLDFNLSSTQGQKVKLSIQKILLWDFENIILSHGRIVLKNGRDVFMKAFSWAIDPSET